MKVKCKVKDIGHRNKGTLRIPYCKTKCYKNSFFPLSFSFWNELDVEAKSKLNLASFKSYLKKRDLPNKLFYYGERKVSAVHARLRMGCSSLNSHLCLILHVKDNSGCVCGANLESPGHFFLHCPLYDGLRQSLIDSIERYTACNINIILFGDKNLPLGENISIFRAVHRFIKHSNRFTK